MEKKVIIGRQPTDYNQSAISIEKIADVHWDYVSGGVIAKSGYYCLYGYIDYSLAKSLVSYSGRHDFGNNVARICIPKSVNSAPPYLEGYLELLAQEGTKPESIISKNQPQGAPPCTLAILSKV